MQYKDIPISVAKEIAETFDKNQVIIVTWDKVHGKTHVTTYGKSLEECKQAAIGGNFIKKALGWPNELCNDVPDRIKNFTYSQKILKEMSDMELRILHYHSELWMGDQFYQGTSIPVIDIIIKYNFRFKT